MKTYNIPMEGESFTKEEIMSVELWNSDNSRHITISEDPVTHEFKVSSDVTISVNLHTNVIRL